MGQTEGYLRTVGKVLDDGVDIRSYARVRDSDDDFRLKAAMANVIEDAAQHIEMRHSRDLASGYSRQKEW
jgi:hypothetical protein